MHLNIWRAAQSVRWHTNRPGTAEHNSAGMLTEPGMATQHRTGKDELQSIAHEAMLRRGLLPDFSPAVIAETNRITQAAAASGAVDPRFAQPALGVDRQRRFPRSRPALGCRTRGGWRREDPGRHRRRRRPGEEGLRDRRPRVDQHDLRLHGRGDLSDAAGEAVDRPHFAGRGRGTAGDRDRDGDRRRRHGDGFGRLPGDGAESRQARLQRPRGMAHGHGSRAAKARGSDRIG